MSFEAPAFLFALLLVPLAAAAYLQLDRRRRRAAEAFALPRMMPSVAPVRPGWRRHAPMALYAVALIGLALALARPEASVAVPDERASVVLAIDQSGSMDARDVEPSRLEAARRVAGDFLDDIPKRLRAGAVTFNHAVQSIEAPTVDRNEPQRAIDALRPSGGTAAGEALATSLRILHGRKGRRAPGAIVLLSDGASTHGREPLPVAQQAKRRKIPIYTVALGTNAGTIEVQTRSGATRRQPVPPDRETLERIARQSRGQFFAAADEAELAAVYERLGSKIGTRQEWREITAAFVAAAALLVIGGGALSLRWFGRLP